VEGRDVIAVLPAALGDILIDQMKPVTWHAFHALASGNDDAEELASLLGHRSVHELRAALVIALECADPARLRQVCAPRCERCERVLKPSKGREPGIWCRECRDSSGDHADPVLLEEYAWLRDNGVGREEAALRAVAATSEKTAEHFEAAYRRRREVA
jgi:hypothetical protein